ncbi:GNAT family N-acetyltransferase [Lentisphaerota bacterium WC36G]|nr:GNAT family N-acetyltransferase [Lentisphaerae bacterium WC36]
MSKITVRPPSNKDEILQLCKLNHQVFANELRLHHNQDNGILIDKFHQKNSYIGAWKDNTAIGMICTHSEEPFSAVERFKNIIKKYIIDGATAEIRLFALQKKYRKNSKLAVLLGTKLFKELAKQNIQRIIISGISQQQEFYEHIGFKTVGDAVQEEYAAFFPMIANPQEVLDRYKSVTTRVMKK